MARGKFGDSVVSAVLVLSWGHADTHTHTHRETPLNALLPRLSTVILCHFKNPILA